MTRRLMWLAKQKRFLNKANALKTNITFSLI